MFPLLCCMLCECIMSVYRLVGWCVAIGQHFDVAHDVFDKSLWIWRVWSMGVVLVRLDDLVVLVRLDDLFVLWSVLHLFFKSFREQGALLVTLLGMRSYCSVVPRSAVTRIAHAREAQAILCHLGFPPLTNNALFTYE